MDHLEALANQKSIQLNRASKFRLDDIETHYIGPRRELPFVACPVSANVDLVEWVKAARNHIESQLLLAGGILAQAYAMRILQPDVDKPDLRDAESNARSALEQSGAVEDALAPFGTTIRSLPVTPERVWQWMRASP